MPDPTDDEPRCTPECWAAKRCPDHGNEMQPRGRDAGFGWFECCENYANPALNKRHLWHEHDSTRIYTDPVGWAQHEAICARCRGDEDA